MTESHTWEAVMAEQDGHTLPRAVVSDDDLGVVAYPLDEGQALSGWFRWSIGIPDSPAVAEEGFNAGALSLELRAADVA